jgi:hypothetical protein
MFARNPGALVVLSVTSCATTASAQIAMPPGAHQLELAQIIGQAGYDFCAVESIDVSTSPDPAFATLRPEVATCTNGMKFLIVSSGRGGVNARRVVRPLPAGA